MPAVEPAPALTGKDNGTIAATIAEFIAYSEGRELTGAMAPPTDWLANSVVAYRKAAQDFAASCVQFGAVYMSEFQDEKRGEAILLHFKNWLRTNVVRKGGKAAYNDVRKFRVAGQFLARNGIKMKADRNFNPQDPGLVDHVDVPRVKKPNVNDVVYYTPSDIQAMLSAADGVHEEKTGRLNYKADDLKDLVFVLLCTGMRDEEVQHLCWSDINWANGDGKMKIIVQDKPQYDWRVKDAEKRIVSPDKNAILKARLKARQEGRGARVDRSGSELVFPVVWARRMVIWRYASTRCRGSPNPGKSPTCSAAQKLMRISYTISENHMPAIKCSRVFLSETFSETWVTAI